MPSLDTFFVYAGALILILIFQYGLRNYAITLIAGFIAFCVFYFSFYVKNFQWEINSILNLLKDAAITYIISFAIGVIIYKLIPLNQNKNVTA